MQIIRLGAGGQSNQDRSTNAHWELSVWAGGLGRSRACDLRRWVPWTLAGGRLGRRDQPSGQQACRRLAVLGGLEGVKLGILAAEVHQLGVPALFDDPAVTQHVDPVRVPDAGHPVRDQEDTAAFSVLADG